MKSITDAWTSERPEKEPPEHKVHDAVYISRWVLLGFICAQVAGVATFLILRCCARKRADGWKPFPEEKEAETQNTRSPEKADYRDFIAKTKEKIAQLKSDSIQGNKDDSRFGGKKNAGVNVDFTYSCQNNFKNTVDGDQFEDIEIGAIHAKSEHSRYSTKSPNTQNRGRGSNKPPPNAIELRTFSNHHTPASRDLEKQNSFQPTWMNQISQTNPDPLSKH